MQIKYLNVFGNTQITINQKLHTKTSKNHSERTLNSVAVVHGSTRHLLTYLSNKPCGENQPGKSPTLRRRLNHHPRQYKIWTRYIALEQLPTLDTTSPIFEHQ